MRGVRSAVAMKGDAEQLMPRLLPLDQDLDPEQLDPQDVDLSAPPTGAQQYLRQVQLEASLCPEVVVAQIDPKKLRKKQSINVLVTGCPVAPTGFVPSQAWQQTQVRNFSDVRQSIAKRRTHWSSQRLDDNVVMPCVTDEEGWRRFCLGEDIHQGAISSDADATLDYTKVGFPPFLSIISRMNQPTVSAVLEFLVVWFEEQDFAPQLGLWLYALLACLEKPLLPEIHSLIRQLARRCAVIRSTLQSDEDERLSALSLLICLVARYFEQNDLADRGQ